MKTTHYIDQWREVKAMTDGKTMDEIRNIFGEGVTNDFVEDGVRIIDTNYKDILVTLSNEDGKVRLADSFECYDKDGVFIGVLYASEF